MKLHLRWTPSMPITLEHIRQVPYVSGIVSEIEMPVGEEWTLESILQLKEEIESVGLAFEVVESVKVHEDIKLGLPTRDKYIQNFNSTLVNLSKAGIKVVCYDFMPVFDWMRTDTEKVMDDGSTTLVYYNEDIEKTDPFLNEFALEDWENFFTPDELKELFAMYENVTEEQLWDNLDYFLQRVIPVAEECDIKLGMHPDDPPWNIFGLPRIITNEKNIDRFLDLYDSPYNGLTLCTGSLGAGTFNDVQALVSKYSAQGKIHFAHMRNVKHLQDGSFEETAHKSDAGSLDIVGIMRSYYNTGFNGYMRPDHGRMIWDEIGMAGYGLYDRSLGAAYLSGIWETLEKTDK